MRPSADPAPDYSVGYNVNEETFVSVQAHLKSQIGRINYGIETKNCVSLLDQVAAIQGLPASQLRQDLALQGQNHLSHSYPISLQIGQIDPYQFMIDRAAQFARIAAIIDEQQSTLPSSVPVECLQYYRPTGLELIVDQLNRERHVGDVGPNPFSPTNPSPDINPLDSFIDYLGGGNGWRNTRSQRETFVGEGVGRGTGGRATEEGFGLPSSRTGYSSRGVNDLEGPELAQRAAEQNAQERQRQRELAERAQESIAEHDLSGEMATPKDPSDKTTGPRPIIFDLDGKGISVTELNQSQKYVDGGDGLLHRTAWAAPGDGVLFFDVSGEARSRKRLSMCSTTEIPALRFIWRLCVQALFTCSNAKFSDSHP